MGNPIDLRPYLICLNLQRELAEALPHSDALTAALWRARACLQWARQSGTPVVHVHTIADPGANHRSRPIEGMEPLHTEVVIAKPTLAAFAAPEWARSSAAEGRRFILVGLSLSSDALATALAGAERDARVLVVRDALHVAPDRNGHSVIDQICRSLAPLVGGTTTEELTTRYGNAFKKVWGKI